VLLGKVNGELVDHVARVASKRAEERAVPVHHDESEARVGLEQLGERLGVEFVVAEVERSADRGERPRSGRLAEGHTY
jgi:hypothetical protein